VFFPGKLKVSKSMKQIMRNGSFEFRVNTVFEDVITSCANMKRDGQPGTWITDEIIDAYTKLHQSGYGHSAECWQQGVLVGGLYGVLLDKVFFGESMFSKVSNASKFAFINWAQKLQQQGIELIDCQMHTPHLESLGAEMISRERFVGLLRELIGP